MTEAEWLKCTDPMPMLEFLQEKASDRKLRLFVCSCFRGSSYWSGVEDIVTVGERYADELASRDEIEAARHRALRSGGRQSVVVTVWDTLSHKELVPGFSHELARLETDLVRCGNHFRDIFRNPFRPITLTPEWRTDTALSLAKGMYDSRDFSAMPDSRGCTSGRRVRKRRHPRPLSRRGAACSRVLGGRSRLGEGLAAHPFRRYQEPLRSLHVPYKLTRRRAIGVRNMEFRIHEHARGEWELLCERWGRIEARRWLAALAAWLTRHNGTRRTPHPMSEHRQRRTGFSTAGSTSNTPCAKIRHHREHGGMYSGASRRWRRGRTRRVICTGFELPGYPATPEPLPD